MHAFVWSLLVPILKQCAAPANNSLFGHNTTSGYTSLLSVMLCLIFTDHQARARLRKKAQRCEAIYDAFLGMISLSTLSVCVVCSRYTNCYQSTAHCSVRDACMRICDLVSATATTALIQSAMLPTITASHH
jgi:hypothetical protein